MDWTVSKQRIELHPHPNADKLEIARVGTAQMVVGKGNYKDGDVVLIIAAKSIIPPGPMRDEFDAMLTGASDARRVKAVRLRGEYSEAITWPITEEALRPIFQFQCSSVPNDDYVNVDTLTWAIMNAEIGEDLAPFLGITKYEPPISADMSGKIAVIEGGFRLEKHDCYHLASYAEEINSEERVVVTEKLHGTQVIYFLSATAAIVECDESRNGEITNVLEPRQFREIVSSKGQLSKGIEIVEEPESPNLYWRAVRKSNLLELCKAIGDAYNALDEEYTIQVFGEVVPIQKGYSYGLTEPVVKVFDVIMDGHPIAYDDLLWVENPLLQVSMNEQPEDRKMTPQKLFDWVPVLYDGPMSGVDLVSLSKGKETLSGKSLHIKEGVVVRPHDTMKKDKRGNIRLHLKIINPKYSDDDEESN